MNTDNRIAALSAIALSLALAGCGESEQVAAPSVAPTATQSAATPKTPSAEPKKMADGNTERQQGSMQVDAGQGKQSLQSMATMVDPKLGEKVAARLGSSEGQKTLADANDRVPSSMGVSGTPKVTTSDVQDMANRFAGRTVYSSQAMHMDMSRSYIFDLDARSPSKPGVRMKVNFMVSDKDLTLRVADLEYYPDASKRTQSFVKEEIPLTDITLDKLERKDENTFVVSGSFKATDLAPGVLANELKG